MAVGFALLWLHAIDLYNTRLIFPFFKRAVPDLGWLYVPFAVLVLVGATNAVNLTDGLDGLAISVFAVAAAAFTALAYVSTHRVFAEYLQLVRPAPAAAELTIFCGSLVGASLGFLWYNSYPADIFMGDVGSLALGGALGTVALLVKQELLLVIVGGVFVLEALSVIIQVGSFKLTGQRVFRMAPLHHHFELDRLERAESDHAVRDPRDHLRALQPDHPQAAMTTGTFSVAGKRVVVVGAARSGVAAAELLVRRGAEVTLTDTRGRIDEEERLLEEGVAARARPARARDARLGRSHRAQPRCAAAQAVIEQARRAGVTVMGELELASRWLRGRVVAITGTKGKSTTTTLTGRMLEAGGHRVLVGGNIGVALSAQVDASTAGHDPRRRGEQLSARDHRHVPAVDRGADEFLARPSGSSRGRGGVRRAKSRIFANQGPDDWAVLNADDAASRAIAQNARSAAADVRDGERRRRRAW